MVAVAPMCAMSLVTAVCRVVRVAAGACVLGVRVSSTLVDGSAAGFAPTVLEHVGTVLTRVSALVMAMLTVVVGVSRSGGIGRVHC